MSYAIPSRERRSFRRIPFVLLAALALVSAGTGMSAARVGETMRSTAPPQDEQAAAEKLAQGWGHLPLSFVANGGQADPQVRFLSHGTGYNFLLTPTEAVWALRQAARRPVGRGPSASGTQPSDKSPVLVKMKLVGGNPSPEVTGVDQLPGTTNYLMGRDPQRWHTKIPSYARVRYRQVYPGIDLVYHGDQRQLEYDFVIAPGANPTVAKLAFEGIEGMHVDTAGDLLLRTSGGEIRQHKPVAYQEKNGTRQSVRARYTLEGGRVGFKVAAYDKKRPLVIDPMLSFASYLGGEAAEDKNGFHSSVNLGVAIAVQGGNIYVLSQTDSTFFESEDAFAHQTVLNGISHFYSFKPCVTKISATGSATAYTTCFGGADGRHDDFPAGLAVDGAGEAYVVGSTLSDDFPIANAFQDQYGDCDLPHLSTDRGGLIGVECRYRGFVTKLNGDGTDFVFSTFLHGGSRSSESYVESVALDSSGNAWVTGSALHSFPTTDGAFQRGDPRSFDAFVTLVDASGSVLRYSTLLGGGADEFGNAIAVDHAGNAYVTGTTRSDDFPTVNAFQLTKRGPSNAFVAKIDPNQTGAASLRYSTYLGGTGFGNFYPGPQDGDEGAGIALDPDGHVYVVGAASIDFPTTADRIAPPFFCNNPPSSCADLVWNGFLTKLNTSAVGAASLLYSTYLPLLETWVGCPNCSSYLSIPLTPRVAVDARGRAYVTGDAPNGVQTTPDAFRASPGQGVLLEIDPNTSGAAGLVYTSYLYHGPNVPFIGPSVAADILGNAYVTGLTGKGAPFKLTVGASGNYYPAEYCNSNGCFVPDPYLPPYSDSFVMKVGDARVETTGSFSEYSLPIAGRGPNAITTGADGNLWFTETNGGVNGGIGKVTLAGVFTQYRVPTSPNSTEDITAGPDGNLWFTENGVNKIGKVTPDGAVTEYSVPTANGFPLGITAGPDGNLWFTELNAHKIEKVTPDGGAFTEYPIVASYITTGPDGNLWFTVIDDDKIGKVTTDGAFTEYPVPTASLGPVHITTGPDGNLWFTEEFANKIGKVTPAGVFTEYDIPTPSSGPVGITAGPDGNLWFTERDANKIGKVTPAGAFTEYSIPTANSGPTGITTGPDGYVWFTEYKANKIGKLGAVQLGAVTVSFGGVTAGGVLTGTPVDPGAAGTLPARYFTVDDLAFDLTTTATVTAPITICVTVPSVTDPAVFATLRILHNEGGTLVDRTILAPHMPAPNFAAKTLCASTDSLSPFAVTELTNRPPVAACKDITVSAGADCTASIIPEDVDNGSSDPDGDPITLTLDASGPFGLGSHSVTLTVTDSFRAASSCSAKVTVVDTTPPTVTCAVAQPMLRIRNHRLVNVGLSSTAVDNCAGALPEQVSVFSDEDDVESSGGQFSPDAADIAAGTLRLRAERKGNGDGRVYLIVPASTDPSGNTGFNCCTVVEPHGRNAASIVAVQAQATAVRAFCLKNNGTPAPGYFVVGDGPVIGKKQ